MAPINHFGVTDIMPGLARDVVSFLQALMPGFVAAWVFYGLTAYRKPDPFERSIQALVYTLIIHALTHVLRIGFYVIGYALPFQFVWTSDSQLIWSVVIALVFGVIMSGMANNNSFHKWIMCRNWWLRITSHGGHWSWTKQSAYPSEWFRAFNEGPAWVVLHLLDERRFYGRALEWPNSSSEGHFLMNEGEWLITSDGKTTSVSTGNVWATVIPVSEVKFVDFVKSEESNSHTSTVQE